MTRDHVSITGTGLVSCLGAGVGPVFRSMCDGDCGIRPIHRFPVDAYPQGQGGIVPEALEQELRERFPEDDLGLAFVVEAGREALGLAGPAAAVGDPGLGLVLATNFGPMETLEWCWRERFEYGTLDPGTFSTYRRFPERAAEELGAAGGVVTLSLSCASGAAAIALGRTWIREGRCERVLAIGYDTLTEYCWCGLTNLRTITTDRLRPFDRDRAGTIFSEGAAAVLLEAESRRRRPALARVAGAAVNNNAFHMTAPAPDADGSRRVMQAALTDAGLEPGSVDHVCAHATGTTANDVTEVAALRNLLGPRLEEVTVAAHKSQLGHMMGGAGAAETIVSVMVLREGRIPPTVNHRNPDPECGVDCVPDRARESRVRCILTNSAGIGGNNAALVLVRGGDVDGGDAG